MRALRISTEWSRAASWLPGGALVGLFVLWAAHDGGYDTDTWYWGALVLLSVLIAIWLIPGAHRHQPPTRLLWALGAFALYVLFSYASIAWAGSPGDALQGSNRALLYLLVLAVASCISWQGQRLRVLACAYSLAISCLAVLILLELATGEKLSVLVADGRLNSPTGYFNSSVALFTAGGGMTLALAMQRSLPSVLRATLLTGACACLQVAVAGQSRGWLVSLPFVVLAIALLLRDRLRACTFALVVGAGALIPLRRLLALYDARPGAPLRHAAERAGSLSLICCAVLLLLAISTFELTRRRPLRPLRARTRTLIGAGVATIALAGAVAGTLAATHGRPVHFVKQQWDGFVHSKYSGSPTGSHFGSVGSGRFDFWRVALDGWKAHPLTGLGQDNFSDYYITRRRTDEEPSWTHSLEMRLLAHTGLIGALLFATFLALGLRCALAARRSADAEGALLMAAALCPLAVWLIHGSLDWFWEVPALSGPALGFFAAVATQAPPLGARIAPSRFARLRHPPRWAVGAAGAVAAVAATVLLAFPYLSVRYTSRASDEQMRNPVAALSDLQTAARLNPFDSTPPRLAGAIALRNGLPNVAASRFAEAIDREQGGWFSWFGAGLAASTLGDATTAQRDLARAEAINSQEPAVREALSRVSGAHPLTPAEAFRLLVVVQ